MTERHDGVAEARRRYEPEVLAGRLTRDDRWATPCRAYNACILPTPVERAAFAEVQAEIDQPSLHRVPPHAIHTNVLWLLPVHEEFNIPKDEIWRQRGRQWTAEIGEVAASTTRFVLHYKYLVATDSAIIAVAAEPNDLAAIRRRLTAALTPPGSVGRGTLVHTTLFRYAKPPDDPAALLRSLETSAIDVSVNVTGIAVVKEKVFPSLDYEVLSRHGLT